MSMIGKSLAHYSITAQIGKGGMGEVYQAKDMKLGRDVAIKVLPEEFARDADRVSRFQREAKLLASLNHPNIAAIHGLEESEGTHFLVLELIEGQTLAERIKGGPIPVEETLKLALQIAEALEAAHEKGVIHRDLKPANIKVTPDGKVKVLDFGLAKAYAGDPQDMDLSNSPTLSDMATQQGVILGTAAYMPPEQAKGKTVDKRADIWAFGVVLFEMLTGRQLFTGETVSETLAAVIKSEPEWNSLPPNLHPRIHLMLERCLEKNPKNRYSGVNDARVDIEKVLADPGGVYAQPVVAAEPKAKLKQMLVWAAVTALLIVIAGIVVWTLRAPEPPLITSYYYELPENQQYNSPTGPVAAVSPDGHQFVYCANGGLYLRSIGELDARLIAGTASENPITPFFSPDSKWIAYISLKDNKLKKIATGGGLPIDLCDINPYFATGWWTDDKIIFSSQTSPGIMQVSTNGGTAELLLDKEDAAAVIGPQILPDGKSMLFTKMNSVQNLYITVRSLESGETRELTAGFLARYLPSGHLVYTKGELVLNPNANLFAVPFDIDKLEITGDEVPLGINVSGTAGCRFSISDSGALVYIPGSSSTSEGEYTLVWVDRYGNEESLGAPAGQYGFPKISHDGKQVALTSSLGSNTNADIFIWDLVVQKPMRRLTFDESIDFQSIWMPNDNQILFWSGRGSDFGGIYQKSADNTGAAELFVSAPDRALYPYTFSKDGKTLVVVDTTNPNSNANISMLSMEGDHAIKPMLPNNDRFKTHPQISHDGKLIAYIINDSSGTNVYVRPFPDVNNGLLQVTTNGGTSPLWSPDSKELFYFSEENQSIMAVVVETQPALSLLTPKKLFSGSAYLIGGQTPGTPWDIHPNGKKFLMIKRPGATSSTEGGTPPIINVLNWFEELKKLAPVD